MTKEKVLFVCTGNYYRSRFAEIYYNHCVGKQMSFSRGFEVFMGRNEGSISAYTEKFLHELGIVRYNRNQLPVQITDQDFEIAGRIIFLDGEEHLPMYKKYFPKRQDEITIWSFPDIQFQSPELILPAIKEKIDDLIFPESVS